jgi:branched-subunit amino acid transport protein
MSAMWWGVIGTSAIAFSLKFLGHSIPEKFLTNARALRINTLIPIALLSALVAVQSVTSKGALVIDQRMSGLVIAVMALLMRAPFPVVVLGSAATSALTYHFMH